MGGLRKKESPNIYRPQIVGFPSYQNKTPLISETPIFSSVAIVVDVLLLSFASQLGLDTQSAQFEPSESQAKAATCKGSFEKQDNRNSNSNSNNNSNSNSNSNRNRYRYSYSNRMFSDHACAPKTWGSLSLPMPLWHSATDFSVIAITIACTLLGPSDGCHVGATRPQLNTPPAFQAKQLSQHARLKP